MAVSEQNRGRIKQAGKFGVVGVVNTFLDFFIFNVLTKFVHLALIPSNTISTTVAMIFSFIANRQVVFKDGRHSAARQAVVFFAVTAFGLYVIQNGIIHILAITWPGPLLAWVHSVRHLGINVFSDAFYVNNGAKAVGTVASLIWNFIMYKKVVFR
jgi:putative flippase GtrA